MLVLKGEDPDGHFHYPYDEDVKGFAVFDRDYNFSLQFYDATRPGLRYNDPFFCTNPEIRIAFLSGSSFFGKYRLFKDSIGMNITASLNPNLSGRQETRYYKIQGDTMLMISPVRQMNGVDLIEHSIWLKASNKP
ncbi:hypothetical protein ES705_48806 [subsurface metagenome]